MILMRICSLYTFQEMSKNKNEINEIVNKNIKLLGKKNTETVRGVRTHILHVK